MRVPPIATGGGRWGAKLGLVCGILYSVGGLFVDLLTVGPNLGTALAFLALVGMPAIFATIGFACGALVAAGTEGARAVRRSLQRRR